MVSASESSNICILGFLLFHTFLFKRIKDLQRWIVVEPYTCSVVSASSPPGPPHDCQRDLQTTAADQYPANSMAPPPPPSRAYTQTEQISPFHPVVSLRKSIPVSPDLILPNSAPLLPTPPPSSHRSMLLLILIL
ncbi:hypothetical protein L2E82_29663 [Cichorium intybus]|uniref:Uncharacterized protein n=1 Tax=Cichorium intybus TaxID=13427 RepID=A0ACB9CYL8_CICIN|nr:hypothetical protein L2E82_29663 [Cichorium intybus]